MRVVIRWKPSGPVPAPASPVKPYANPVKAYAEQRRCERLPVNYRFLIYFPDAKGAERCIPARSLNMSKSGALVEADEPIAVGTTVYVRVNNLGLMGTGSVRHCRTKGARFRMGLHFPHALTRIS
ncbi:MAG TPA: PilZ domain-containing protein [Bryobacteraceae bacterium]|nr:PilZ domain-containing protein [Bryobacteraceae bacterium]